MFRRAHGVFFFLLLCSSYALCHPGHGESSLAHGLGHPFTGLDHILAMVAVGLLGAHHGGKLRWVLPLTFVCGLALGGLLGAGSVALPAVEMTIAISILVFGILLSVGEAVSPSTLIALVALGAIPHGHAHLAESSGGGVLYGLGMVAGSALLHGAGLAAGLAAGRLTENSRRWALGAGATLACVGAALTVSIVL